jgi:hypothetical protein
MAARKCRLLKQRGSFLVDNFRLRTYCTASDEWPAVAVTDVQRFIEECMTSVGTRPAHAKSLAENLVAADHRGHYSHGLNRLGVYSMVWHVKNCVRVLSSSCDIMVITYAFICHIYSFEWLNSLWNTPWFLETVHGHSVLGRNVQTILFTNFVCLVHACFFLATHAMRQPWISNSHFQSRC